MLESLREQISFSFLVQSAVKRVCNKVQCMVIMA